MAGVLQERHTSRHEVFIASQATISAATSGIAEGHCTVLPRCDVVTRHIN